MTDLTNAEADKQHPELIVQELTEAELGLQYSNNKALNIFEVVNFM